MATRLSQYAMAVCTRYAAFMLIAPLLFLLLQDPGRQEFVARCASCHGADGRGGEHGPAIVLRGRSEQDLSELIRKGIPGSGMPGFQIAPPKMQPLVAFVRSLGEASREVDSPSELKSRR